jgi:hypothetical protein
MDIARRSERVARNVRTAVNGTPISVLASAADIDPDTLVARLNGHDELTVADLVTVGGFLHVHPNVFLRGAAQ